MHQYFTATIGFDWVKRQRTRCSCAEHEGAFSIPRFGLHKPLVDGIDQRLCRAEVGVQHIVAAFGRRAGLQVAVNVRTAKTIDGLLGVANQQQSAFRAVACRLINLVKQAVLQRRGVLKLVNQRHRILRQNAGAQGRTVIARQRGIQPLQHVGKAKGTGLALEPQQALLHMDSGMQAQRHARGRQGIQCLQQLRQLRKFGGQQQVHGRALEGLGHAFGAQALAGGIAQLQRLVQRVLCPRGNAGEPVCVVARLQLALVP